MEENNDNTNWKRIPNPLLVKMVGGGLQFGWHFEVVVTQMHDAGSGGPLVVGSLDSRFMMIRKKKRN